MNGRYPDYGLGQRLDGTNKGPGFASAELPDGSVMTELTPTYADAAHFYAAVVDRTAARWPDETKAIMLEGENDARRKS